MRTSIEIDSDLMQQAMARTGAATEQAVVEDALRLLLAQLKAQEGIRELFGKLEWEGHLEESRLSRF